MDQLMSSRLQGEISGIKKVIYLFLDFHNPVDLECDNIFAKDISLYFAENFDKLNSSNKTYDFFLEIFPKYLQYSKRNNKRDIYIMEVRKLFRKIFQFDSRKKSSICFQIFF